MPREILTDEERLKRRRESYKRYRENHPDRTKAAQTAYRTSDKGRKKKVQLQRSYLDNLSPERRKEVHAADAKQISRNLTDTYIKKLIVRGSALRFRDIPPEVVELKRAAVLLQRLLDDE